MTDSQENQISMFFKVNVFFTNHLSALTTSIPVLSDTITSFTDKLNLLGDYEQEATETITGYALQKQNLRNQLRDAAMVVSGGLVAFALSQDDESLAGKGRLNRSTLDTIRDTEFLYKCEKLITVCNPFALTGLPDYGVNSTKMANFINLTGNFKQILENPADQRSEGSAYGNKVDKTIDELMLLLLIIDGLMETIFISHDILYMQYKLDRMIDDNTGGNGTPPDYTVTIPASGFLQVVTLPYLASRSFKAKNLSADAINWCLSSINTGFSNPPHVLDAASTSTLLSSTLAPDGDILLFQNTSLNPIAIEVTVLE